MTSSVLFIHGGGTGAYAEDRLLADALQRALGPGYDVHYPQMPDEENCPYPEWKAEIDARLAAMTGSVALAGHSIGRIDIVEILVRPTLAAANRRSVRAGRAVLGSGQVLAVVPFSQLALYAAKLPRATIHELDGRGHQFNRDLAEVAAEIKRA